jgi:steroid delta-isomerase-like uncharacterized protein
MEEQAKQLPKQFVDTFNEQDAEALKSLFTPDTEWVVPGATLQGRNQVADLERAFWQAFPDGRRTIDRLVAEGSTVVEEGSFTGTHTGTFHAPVGSIPPSGNRVEFSYVVVLDVRGGQIPTKHFYFDTHGLLVQLGAVPATPSV